MKFDCDVIIKIKNKKQSKKLQKYAYKNGYDWNIKTEKYICTDTKYLILHTDNRITWSYDKEDKYLFLSYKEAIRYLKRKGK